MKEIPGFGEEIRDAVRSAMEDVQAAMQDVHTSLSDIDFGDAGESDIGEDVERSFEVGPGAELSVSNVSGDTRIRAEEGSVIRVQARKSGSSRRLANTQIEFDQAGNRVTVRTRAGQAGRWGIVRNVGSVEYDIIVPRGCKVHVHTVSGDVDVRGTGAPLAAETVNGDITIDDISGDSTITTVNGDVQGTRLEGALAARSTNGDITIKESRLRRFTLNSVSGDFFVETPLTVGEHYFAKTVSGDLQLIIPRDARATIQLKTVSGDMHLEHPAEIIKAGRRNWQGRINGGGATVEMQSVSGDLDVSAGSGLRSPIPVSEPHAPVAPAPPAAPGAPTPPAPAAEPAPIQAGEPPPGESETSKILGELERGEITVEEAMQRLEALR
jgi:hypothetical protein